MSKPFLPFALPEISEDDIAEVVSTLRSGWITTGPKARQFESDFAKFLGGEVEAIAVNSATAGLHLGLEALGICPGDAVITTTHTFTATAEVIRYLGADPIFVDIDPDSLCIDVKKIEPAITERTKAVIPVHFGGRAANMDGILEIARKYNLRVMEDAAHAFPATYKGQFIGKLKSDVTVFSFYANKTMTTGEGGMLVTSNPEIAHRAKIMRLHGISRDAFDRFTSEKPAWFYEIVAPGFKYNMTDIAASLGIQQLKKADSFQKKREKIATMYYKAFADDPIILPPQAEVESKHAWHLYPIQLSSAVNISRDKFIELMYTNGIGCSVHYIPLHLQPYWRDRYNLKSSMFPVSQLVYERTLSLPIYSLMNDDDVENVIKVVKKLLGNA